MGNAQGRRSLPLKMDKLLVMAVVGVFVAKAEVVGKVRLAQVMLKVSVGHTPFRDRGLSLGRFGPIFVLSNKTKELIPNGQG
jgi:hypothetical protein